MMVWVGYKYWIHIGLEKCIKIVINYYYWARNLNKCIYFYCLDWSKIIMAGLLTSEIGQFIDFAVNYSRWGATTMFCVTRSMSQHISQLSTSLEILKLLYTKRMAYFHFFFLCKVFLGRECLWDQSFMLNSLLRNTAINFNKNVWIANVTESLWTFQALLLWESIKKVIITLSEWAKETRGSWMYATRVYVAWTLGTKSPVNTVH